MAQEEGTEPAVKTAIVTVRGGVVCDVQVPEGVRVLVRDYDTDGEPFVEAVWEQEK